ncbi:hypothetical protein D3C87_1574150 [compost metagenome]
MRIPAAAARPVATKNAVRPARATPMPHNCAPTRFTEDARSALPRRVQAKPTNSAKNSAPVAATTSRLWSDSVIGPAWTSPRASGSTAKASGPQKLSATP